MGESLGRGEGCAGPDQTPTSVLEHLFPFLRMP
jgi:hypothetical protein